MRKFSDKSIKELWSRLLTLKASQIYSIVGNYPRERSLVINYEEMDSLNRDFALDFLDRPDDFLKLLREVFQKEFLPTEFKENRANRINIRITTKLQDLEKKIRDLRSEDLNKFIQVDGIVKRATEVTPTITMAAYECSYCKRIGLYEQSGPKLIEPTECYLCAKSKELDKIKFKFVPEKSVFHDTQIIEIQEKPELLKGATQPARVNVHLMDDLCGKLNPGDRVKISGILRGKQKNIGNTMSTQFEIFLEASYFEKESTEYEEIEISDEEEEEIKKIASDPDAYSKLIQSIAPTIYGMEHVKEAITLQLFGAIRKRFQDGTTIRGEIHILLLGDPGTAKSQLLKYAVNVAPKSIYSSGKGSSAAGLTAAAIKDDLSEGRWTLEAGTLVLADGGLAAIDELDKMEKEDRSAMHEAMEQQTVTIAKAGINATLMSRCAILGAANPKLGRLQEDMSIVEQTDLPPSLLSRFDLIFVVRDTPGKQDENMTDYILNVHTDGEKIAGGKDVDKSVYKPLLSPDFIRKYVVYARKNSFPILSPEARQKIKEYYLEKRLQSKETKTMIMTPRQLEALIRLSEASARVRLSERINEEDVNRAIRLMEYFLRDSASVNGKIDIDLVTTGHSSKERTEISIILDIIERYESQFGFAKLSDIESEAERNNISKETLERLLKVMKNNAMIYEYRNDIYKVLRSKQGA